MARPHKDYQFCSIKLDKEIYKFLKGMASKENTTMTHLLERAAIEKYGIEKEGNNGKQ